MPRERKQAAIDTKEPERAIGCIPAAGCQGLKNGLCEFSEQYARAREIQRLGYRPPIPMRFGTWKRSKQLEET